MLKVFTDKVLLLLAVIGLLGAPMALADHEGKARCVTVTFSSADSSPLKATTQDAECNNGERIKTSGGTGKTKILVPQGGSVRFQALAHQVTKSDIEKHSTFECLARIHAGIKCDRTASEPLAPYHSYKWSSKRPNPWLPAKTDFGAVLVSEKGNIFENSSDRVLICRVKYKGGLYPGYLRGSKCHIATNTAAVSSGVYQIMVGTKKNPVRWKRVKDQALTESALSGGSIGLAKFIICRTKTKSGDLQAGAVIEKDQMCATNSRGKILKSKTYDVGFEN